MTIATDIATKAEDACVAATPAEPTPAAKVLTFVVNTPIRDLAEFRALAELATKLKSHGRVEVNISALAEKSRHEMPEQGSPWHEYAACNPTPAKFFPDEMIAPFIPAAFVEKNRKLLLDKVAILREYGLGAAFWSYEPNFLPSAFFDAYPELRGPRTDHPRRSRQEQFAPCVDAAATREMTSGMIEQIARNVPELGTYFFKTNDAGPGLCWSDWQYSGPNGPRHCQNHTIGERGRGLVDSIIRGGEKGGAKLTVHMTGNFSAKELKNIRSTLPKNAHVRGDAGHSVHVGSCADRCYPVRGLLDLVGTLRSLQRIGNNNAQTVFVDFRSFYDRSYEDLPTTSKMIDVVDDFLTRPSPGAIGLLTHAKRICDRWVGESFGNVLFEAMLELDETLKFKSAALPRVSAIYGGVSLRYITRPLLVAPDRLTAEEESYFLPHVFNVSNERARDDYIDIHGTRLSPEWVTLDAVDPRVWPIENVCARLSHVATKLESLASAPDGDYWHRMGAAVRLYGTILRSCGNFFAAQIIRDRNQAAFSNGHVRGLRQGASRQVRPGTPT